MLIRKAYKYRLKTNLKLESKLSQMAGCCRFVWNQALRINLHRLENKQPILWYNELSFWLTFWKQTEELAFLKDANAQSLQQTLKNLNRAFKDAFDKKQPLKRIPTFKKKGQYDSFRIVQHFKIEGNRIKLPKLGWIRFIKSRDIEGKHKNVTVSKRAGHWYVSIKTEQELEQPIHSSTAMVGIDLGITQFATLSDGTHYDPLNSFKSLQEKLAKAQRKLSKKTKFSANWKKQKAKISKLHAKIANARNDYLHKTSTAISKNHAMIAIEDLKVANMSKSAKGSVEKPGKNVAAKSGLNKSILDQGWSEFRRQLEYKQLWRGGDLIAVNPRNTSRTCHLCNHTDKYSRRSQSEFCCTNCGTSLNADCNAAKNILALGHRVLACGAEPLGAAVKQEPLAA